MTDVWFRSGATRPSTNGFYGGVQMIQLVPGQTALRTWWNIEVWGTWADVAAYPPGSSQLKAGVVYDDAGLAENQMATPWSNPNSDWMALSSINPRIVQLSRATNVAWQIHWGFTQDQSVKSQRKNQETFDKALYLTWEFALGPDRIANFAVTGWSVSMDTLVRTP